MPHIRVHRHGERWAVGEPGAESPLKEFPSREAAELAARQMAGGGAVEVVDEDPTGLPPVQDPDPDADQSVDTASENPRGIETPERLRSVQPGL